MDYCSVTPNMMFGFVSVLFFCPFSNSRDEVTKIFGPVKL